MDNLFIHCLSQITLRNLRRMPRCNVLKQNHTAPQLLPSLRFDVFSQLSNKCRVGDLCFRSPFDRQSTFRTPSLFQKIQVVSLVVVNLLEAVAATLLLPLSYHCIDSCRLWVVLADAHLIKGYNLPPDLDPTLCTQLEKCM